MHELEGKKILVTGSTGFTGGHLTRRLLKMGLRVVILVRSPERSTVRELCSLGAELSEGDIRDRSAVFKASEGVDIVFHLAALFRQAKFPDQAYYDVNLEGTRHVLDAAEEAGVGRVVHCSTVGVHSHILNPPASEDEAYRPADVYQDSKCEGEKLAQKRFGSQRVEGVVVRPAMIWGEGDRRIFKVFAGIAHRRLPIIGSGKTWTHWIYVQDLVDGFLLAATRPEARGQTYIFAGETPVMLEELFKTIADIAGVSLWPVKVPALPVQWAGSLTEWVCRPIGLEPPLHRRRVDFFTKHRWFDTRKAQSELDFKPSLNFEAEVRRIFQWYKEHGWLSEGPPPLEEA